MDPDGDKATNRDEAVGQSNTEGQAATRLGERYTVQEAARLLGTTVDAVRGRIRRGSLDSMKVDGAVCVLLDEASRDRHAEQATRRLGETSSDQGTNPNDRTGEDLVEDLRDQIAWLRREVERKDTLLMQMAQADAALAARVPELEGPSETRESPETTHASAEGVASRRRGGGLQGRAPVLVA